MEMPQNESQQKSKKFITKISDEAERKHGEKVLDEAIENTFPASDPSASSRPSLRPIRSYSMRCGTVQATGASHSS